MINEDILAYIDEYRLQASLNKDSYSRAIQLSVFDACEAAVKKQIPKKPKAHTIAGITAYKCDCGEIVSPADYYCPFCGQAIDWDNTKEN